MCTLNFIYCYLCFSRVGKFEVSQCSLQNPCPVFQIIHFDRNYKCGWCVVLKMKDRTSWQKRGFFQLLGQLHQKPGSQVALHQKMKNYLYDDRMVKSFLTQTNTEFIQQPFAFSLFDGESP